MNILIHWKEVMGILGSQSVEGMSPLLIPRGPLTPRNIKPALLTPNTITILLHYRRYRLIPSACIYIKFSPLGQITDYVRKRHPFMVTSCLRYVHTWRLHLRLRQRHLQFNIALMETQMHTHRMGMNPFLMFYIDTMLNLDGDVDANADANVKCEHTITKK